jgi:hypothetical protein
MRPVASTAGDIYAPHVGYQYQEEMVKGYDLRERARELEEYLLREGRYAELRGLTCSSDIVTHIVGRVICTLLGDRDGHRRRDVAIRPGDRGPGSGLGWGLEQQPGNFPAFAYGRGRLSRH